MSGKGQDTVTGQQDKAQTSVEQQKDKKEQAAENPASGAPQAQKSKPNLQVQSVRSIATLGTMSAGQKKKKKWYDAMFWQMSLAEWFIVLIAIFSTWIVIALFFWGQLEISEVIRATDYLVIPDVWYLNTRYNYEYTFTFIPGNPPYELGISPYNRNLLFNKPMCQNQVGNGPVPLGKEDPTCTMYPQYPWQFRYYANSGSKARTGNQQLACSQINYIKGYTPYGYQEAALNGDSTALNSTCLYGLYKPLFQQS